jgi:hypothetical protein
MVDDMNRTKKQLRALLTALMVGTVCIVGCEQLGISSKAKRTRTLAELDDSVNKLQAEVAGLEKALTRLDAAQPKWALWSISRTLEYRGPGTLTGEAPAQPLDAFDSKEACADASKEKVMRVVVLGEGQFADATSYKQSYPNSVTLITLRCLPETIDPRRPKG